MKGNIYFEIQADDVERAINFYSKVLGWEFEKEDKFPIDYWRINAGKIRGGILKRPAKTPPSECGTNAFVCSFEVDDFDSIAQMINELGGIVALPKFAIPNVCWQGYFVDTEGNTFGLFQSDENAKIK